MTKLQSHFLLSTTDHALNAWRVDYLVGLIFKAGLQGTRQLLYRSTAEDNMGCVCEWVVQNTQRTCETTHESHIPTMPLVHTCNPAYCVQTKGGRLKRKRPHSLKPPEGKGRANPWLSTLLSLQTWEPFANAPLHFYFDPPFWLAHEDACVFHLNPWQTACEWQRSNGFQGDCTSNAPRHSGIQCYMPHFCSQAQATESSIQQASTWTGAYHIIKSHFACLLLMNNEKRQVFKTLPMQNILKGHMNSKNMLVLLLQYSNIGPLKYSTLFSSSWTLWFKLQNKTKHLFHVYFRGSMFFQGK